MTAKTEIGVWLKRAANSLAGLSETPTLEAQVLAAAVLDISRTRVVTYPETVLAEKQMDALEDLLARRLNGEPLPYLIGKWEFFGLEFFVSPAVLIPRPETELLVEEALSWLKLHPERRTAADIGTGSGCIAVSLAVSCPGLNVFAGDLSRPALQVAWRNVRHHQAEGQVSLYQGSLLECIAVKLDLLCANLPYIPTAKAAGLEVARYEPFLALAGGPDGLDLIRRLLDQARSHMAPGGLILLEIEAGQAEPALVLARACFPGATAWVLNDLASLARLLVIENRPESG
jgi:release factor glutamine methyltransferase